MFNSLWILLAVLISSSSFAGTTFLQKRMKVQSLMKLKLHAPLLAFEAYERELGYEAQGLSVKARAKNETNLLAAKIRMQVIAAYKAALNENKSKEDAREEVKANIENDLNLAAPKLKEELQDLAIQTLDSIDAGGSSEEVDLSNVELVMQKEVVARKEFLDADQDINQVGADPINPSSNPSKDSDRRIFNSKAEIIESLVSDRESSRWVITSYQTINTAQITRKDSNISLQIKFEFLGASIEAGPMISFKRQYTTNATIMGESLNPILTRDGNFDFWKRDRAGKVVVKNGKDVKKFIFFTCDSSMEFESEYTGSGGFKYLDLGEQFTISRKYVNTVNLASRRIVLPEYVAGKSVTMKFISELCHQNFLNAKLSNSITVAQSLNILMKNLVAGLTFSHPKTKCAVDDQCYSWFNNEVSGLLKSKNFPRCREENSREKFRSCQLLGLEGQNCPVIEGGKRTSSGEWEYACDTGLKCVKYQSQTFVSGYVWKPAKGKCVISNKKTYRNPFDIANDSGYVDINLQN